MLSSKQMLSAQAATKLRLASSVVALSIAAATFAGAVVPSAHSTRAASAPTLEAQMQILRECEQGLDYGGVDSFEGMLLDFACVS